MIDNNSKKIAYEIVARLYVNEFIKNNPDYAVGIESLVARVKRILRTQRGQKDIYSYFKKVLFNNPKYLSTISFFMEMLNEP